MNTIEKQKRALIILGVVIIALSVLSLIFGIILTVTGAKNLSETINIIKLVFGILLILVSIPFACASIKYIWVGAYLKATQGSIKEGNIAKEGGTVNMKKCDKCGTQIKEGETACSNCGKEIK